MRDKQWMPLPICPTCGEKATLWMGTEVWYCPNGHRVVENPETIPTGGGQEAKMASDEARIAILEDNLHQALRFLNWQWYNAKKGISYPPALSDAGSMYFFTMIEKANAALGRTMDEVMETLDRQKAEHQ